MTPPKDPVHRFPSKKKPRDLHDAGDRDVFPPLSTDGLSQGRVIANFGIESTVLLDGLERRLGNPLKRSPVAGDIVWTDGRAILGIEPRGRVLARFVPGSGVKILASHLDQVGVVCSASLPPFHPDFVERYVIYCRIVELPFFIVLNKMDEAQESVVRLTEPFVKAGIDVIPVSAHSGQGLDVLSERLAGCTTILSGLSGVGKSTLINSIIPDAQIATQVVGGKTKEGRHTTTTSRLWPLADGTIIDSPGIRRFGLVGIRREELRKGFPEFDEVAAECRFTDCLHDTEGGCAVREAAGTGRIDKRRFEQYLDFLGIFGG